MKKTVLFILIFIIHLSISAKEKLSSSAGISTGHSWFHNYSGYSEHGMNITLNFQPALDRYFRIHSSLSLHFQFEEKETSDPGRRKAKFFAPSSLSDRKRYFRFLKTGFFFSLEPDSISLSE